MKKNNLTLTQIDRLILNSYCQLLDGLTEYLGRGYEMVLHSLENYEHSAMKVINGFHTGRTEGAPITDVALNMLEEIRRDEKNAQGITYFSQNSRGEPLKSATIPIKGEGDRIIGLLCINFYMNTSVSDFFQSFMSMSGCCDVSRITELNENFSQNSTDLLKTTVWDTREKVFKDTSISSTNKNKEIIHRLYMQGIFNLKDSVSFIARELNISKNTVYLHLRNMEKD